MQASYSRAQRPQQQQQRQTVRAGSPSSSSWPQQQGRGRGRDRDERTPDHHPPGGSSDANNANVTAATTPSAISDLSRYSSLPEDPGLLEPYALFAKFAQERQLAGSLQGGALSRADKGSVQETLQYLGRECTTPQPPGAANPSSQHQHQQDLQQEQHLSSPSRTLMEAREEALRQRHDACLADIQRYSQRITELDMESKRIQLEMLFLGAQVAERRRRTTTRSRSRSRSRDWRRWDDGNEEQQRPRRGPR